MALLGVRGIAVLLVLACSLVVTINASGDVTWGVDRERIRIGDTLSLFIQISSTENFQASPIALADALGDFVVRDVNTSVEKTDDGMVKATLRILLTVFSVGKKTIPALPIARVHSGRGPDTVWTRPVEVLVESAVPEDAKDIKDIKQPLSVPSKWKQLLWSYSLIASLVAGSLASVLFSLRHRQEVISRLKKVLSTLCRPLRVALLRLLRMLGLSKLATGPALEYSTVEPDLPPDEAALKELQRIEALGLVEKGLLKEHYTLVSESIRRYFERKLSIPAMEQPTTYTLSDLMNQKVPDGVCELSAGLLCESDLVKFARYVPEPKAVSSLLERGRRIVEKMQPHGSQVAQEEIKNAAR